MALICNPATQITNRKYGDCKKIATSTEQKNNQTRKKYQRRSGIVVCVTDVCGFFNGLAFLMTADLDAQPRLTKHFDSPFVVRLRLCFSSFYFIIVFLTVQVFAKDRCLLSIASYYHYPCRSHETTRLSIYVLSWQGGFLAFHHCGVYVCS